MSRSTGQRKSSVLSVLPTTVRLQWHISSDTADTVISNDVAVDDAAISPHVLAFLADTGASVGQLRNSLQLSISRDKSQENIIIVETHRNNKEGLEALQNWRTNVFCEIKEFSDRLCSRNITCKEDTFHFIVRHVDQRLSKNADVLAFVNDGTNQIDFVSTETGKDLVDILLEDIDDAQLTDFREVGKNQQDSVLLKSCCQQFQDRALDIAYNDGALSARGLSIDVEALESEIRRRRDTFTVKIQRLPQGISGLYSHPSAAVYIQERVRTTTPADADSVWWEVENACLNVVGATDSMVNNTVAAVEGCIQQWSSAVVPQKLTALLAWSKCLQFLEATFPGKFFLQHRVSTGRIHIAGTGDVINRVVRHVEDFLKRHKLVSNSLELGPFRASFVLNCMKSRLEEELVQEMVEINPGKTDSQLSVTSTEAGFCSLEKVLDNVTSFRYGLTKWNYFTLLQQDAPGRSVFVDLPAMFEVYKNHIQLKLVNTRIEELMVDVIVSSTAPSFAPMLSLGSSARAIMQTAGEEALQEMRRRYPTGIDYGEIAEGDGGHLSCKKIYHVVMQKYSDAKTPIQTLRDVIQSCLERAHNGRFNSIAFPALCTGNLQYPPEVVADVIMDEVVRFINTAHTTLMEIIITVLPTNVDVKQAFHNEQKRRRNILTEFRGCNVYLVEQPPSPLLGYVHVISDSPASLKEAKLKLIDHLSRNSCIH